MACKDGRFKYEINNFVHSGAGSGYDSVGAFEKYFSKSTSPNNKQWKEMKAQCREKTEALIVKLKEAMSKPASGDDF